MTTEGTTTDKRTRKRQAKAALLMDIAVTVETWSTQISGQSPGIRPFSEWPDNDSFVKVARTFDLTGDDLAGVLSGIAGALETQAMRAGYEEIVGVEEA